MKFRSTSAAAPVVAGFDVGQSSTTCALVNLSGRLLAHGSGPGVSHLSADGGPARFRAAVETALRNAMARAEAVTPRAAAIGATGVMDRTSPEAQVVAELVGDILPDAVLTVAGDAETALFGAHGGAAGVIVISGTGSIALGQDAHGRQVRAGGWGWLVDDAGSAFAIGRDGLQAAVRGAEGSGPTTQLTARMRAHFQVDDLYAVKRTVYAPDFGARGFAALAPLVSEIAAVGDAVAQALITRAAEDLAGLVNAVTHQLATSVPADDRLPVACLGGAFRHVFGLHAGFVAALARRQLNVQPCNPLLPPDLGAALMALHSLGVDPAAALPTLLEAAHATAES